MMGVYDFCGHYDWTFEWLRRRGGDAVLRRYWREAISHDSQAHARAEFAEGFDGMVRYWGHTLAEEGAGYTSGVRVDERSGEPVMRLDMTDCPSKGFLLRNDLEFSPDYCDHCIGWIGPAMADAGFRVDHAHDHAAHCWWEMRRADDPTPATPVGIVASDVRERADWQAHAVHARCTRPGDVGSDPGA